MESTPPTVWNIYAARGLQIIVKIMGVRFCSCVCLSDSSAPILVMGFTLSPVAHCCLACCDLTMTYLGTLSSCYGGMAKPS